MKQFIVDRHTTPNTPTLEQVPTDKIPLYPSEQDLLDDLANLEVGQIVGVIDPAESELIGVLMQRIQALEDKLESDDVYSTEEVKTNKTWIDGKPIYRKTVKLPNQTSVNQKVTLSITDLNVDTPIKSEFNYYQNNEKSTGVWAISNPVQLRFSQSEVNFETNNFSSSSSNIFKDIYATLFYTKTTD